MIHFYDPLSKINFKQFKGVRLTSNGLVALNFDKNFTFLQLG